MRDLPVTNSGYRRLNRSPFGMTLSRNVTFFVVLIGLVVFIALFYLYISVSGELQALKEEYNNQGKYLNKLKNELLETNMKFETARNTETDCKMNKNSIDLKLKECQNELQQEKTAIENNKKGDEETIGNLKLQLEEANKIVDTQKSDNTNLNNLLLKQNLQIQELNEQILLLRKQLETKNEFPLPLNMTTIQSNNSLLKTSTQKFSDSLVKALPNEETTTKANEKSTTTKEENNIENKEVETMNSNEEGAKISKKSSEKDLENGQEEEMRGEHGEFLADREAGARVRIEEKQAKAAQKDEGKEAPLIKAAQEEQNDKRNDEFSLKNENEDFLEEPENEKKEKPENEKKNVY